MHAFTATTPGTGKSYLVDIVSMIATGQRAPGFSYGSDDAENRKQLDSALLAGRSMIVLDNVSAPIAGDRLNQILTEERATVRPLGQSREVEVECGAVVLANGNNLAIAADMTRRTLICRLDAKLERPELRTFEHSPHEKLTYNRMDYVAHVLTVLRAFHVAGRPGRPGRPPEKLKPLGSFESWSSLIAGALIWLGHPDPADSIEHVRDNDPKRAEHLAVLEQWNMAIADRPVTTRDIIEAALVMPDFREALLAVAGASGNIDTRRLGKWLSAVAGKLAGGLAIEPATVREGNRRWQLAGARHAAADDLAGLP